MVIDLESELGLNIPKHEENEISRKAATIEALKEYSLGDDSNGKPRKLTAKEADHLFESAKSGEKEFTGFIGRTVDKIPGLRGLNRPEADAFMTGLKADFDRSNGDFRFRKGSDIGSGFGFGHFKADRKHLALASITDTGALIGEGLSNSFGRTTSQQRRQYKTGGIVGKAGTVAAVGFNAYNIISTGLQGGDMYDAVSDNLQGMAMFGGISMGAKLGGALGKGGKETGKAYGSKLRVAGSIAGGLTGGLIASGIASGVMSTVGDITKSNSSIVKAVKGNSMLLGSMGSIEQNNKTLTMRQKALQQLSQSAMNDRGSILGSEASILRGYM